MGAVVKTLTPHQIRTWAAIQAVGSDAASQLSSQAFHACADEVERLRSLLADLLSDCENWGCSPDDKYSEGLK